LDADVVDENSWMKKKWKKLGEAFLKYKKSAPAGRNHRVAIKRAWANQRRAFGGVVLLSKATSAFG
jgi:hypothetical protein